jgi:NTP pyrophosphatase (non-canonical NTP hydrolase)
MENIVKIMNLSKKRINHLHNIDNCWWYEWYNTYLKEIINEIEETKEEIKEKNSVYLEDELWDIFWCYICLLNSLEQDKLINKEDVFKRCFNKFSERLWNSPRFESINWQETKKKQKEELKKEHLEKYRDEK